ncbi:MAG: type II secretion system protein [Acidobacteriota bacterium]
MQPEHGSRRSRSRGFTLLELMVVMTIVGILATLALPQFKGSTQKAKESVLKEDLWVFRDVTDQYKADKGEWPTGLQDLVDGGYLRKIPIDPITGSRDTWTLVPYEEPSAESNDDPDATKGASGFWDVKSGAAGTGLDGTPYSEW